MIEDYDRSYGNKSFIKSHGFEWMVSKMTSIVMCFSMFQWLFSISIRLVPKNKNCRQCIHKFILYGYVMHLFSHYKQYMLLKYFHECSILLKHYHRKTCYWFNADRLHKYSNINIIQIIGIKYSIWRVKLEAK